MFDKAYNFFFTAMVSPIDLKWNHDLQVFHACSRKGREWLAVSEGDNNIYWRAKVSGLRVSL